MGDVNLCEKYQELMQYINFCEYSIPDIALVGVGTMFWVVCYIAVIRHSFKRKFIEMPMFVAAGNIGWEFVWSFLFITNMGTAFLWGYRAWFFLDLFIFYLIFVYGYKQTGIPILQKYFKVMFLFVTAFWTIAFYFFVKGGYDTAIGATSAYMISVGISTLYITLFLFRKDVQDFSWTAAWTRACGDIIMTIFVLRYYNIPLLLVMGAYVGILDIIYVILVYRARRELKTREALA